MIALDQTPWRSGLPSEVRGALYVDPAGFAAGFGPDARDDCAKPNGAIAKNAMAKNSLLIFMLVMLDERSHIVDSNYAQVMKPCAVPVPASER